MANASDALIYYKPPDFPQLPGSTDRYIVAELRRLQAIIAQQNAIIKALDVKQVAHGW
jgi:hypothetical protein